MGLRLKKKKAEKICVYCNEEIFDNERAVLLRTFEGDKIIEDVYFHLSCYKRWHDERAIEKSKHQMKALIGMSMSAAKNIMAQNEC